MNTSNANSTGFAKVEWVAAILISLGLLLLHLAVLNNAGGLWRDEINTATVAQARTVVESWNLLPFESAPFLFHLLLRGWTAVLGGSDGVLRTFGFFIGLGIVAALWLNARTLGRSLPLISLAVFGMNSIVIRFGDSVRSYGLGVFFMLTTVALVWRLATAPNRRVLVLATISALAAVQSLYQNAFFVFAACLGGMAVTLRHRLWPRTGLILAVGGIAAVSLLPYLRIIHRARPFLALYQDDFGFASALAGFVHAMNSSGVFLAGSWAMFLILAACVAVAAQFPAKFSLTPDKRDLALYAGLVATVASACFLAFWKNSQLDMSAWYTMLPLALFAVFLDAMVAVLPATSLRRLFVLCLSVGLVAGSFPTVWRNSHRPHTNLRDILAKLGASAEQDDLIVVMPWYLGTTFQRYYHGPAPWITIPELGSYEIQREDLLKDKLATPNAAASAIEKMSRTLQSGKAIWVVGQPRFMVPADYVPQPLPPAPQGPRGWFAAPYLHLWRDELTFFLKHHTQTGGNPIEPTADPNLTENVPLWVFEGWR